MTLLQRVSEYLVEQVKPFAQTIDHDPTALRKALKGLCELEAMSLKRPTEFGGPATSEGDFRSFQEQVARSSGTLAFLQTQHQSAVSMLSKSDNSPLKQAYLPFMHNGEKLLGIGFSQLRRPGKPVLQAVRDGAGYVLEGTVPWMTGLGFFPEFIVGAALEDGSSLFGIIPTEAIGVVPSAPMKLAAMEAAQTVSISIDGFLLTDNQVVFVKPIGWIQNNDQINITLQGHFAIGCALAGIDIVRQASSAKALPFLGSSADQLETEVCECREAMIAKSTDSLSNLAIRAWAIELAVRCAHAAVTASSGLANSSSHPAQRVFREALVFTVSAQTTPIMESTMARLVQRR